MLIGCWLVPELCEGQTVMQAWYTRWHRVLAQRLPNFVCKNFPSTQHIFIFCICCENTLQFESRYSWTTKTASIHCDENYKLQIIVSRAGFLSQHVIKKLIGGHNNVWALLRIGRQLLSFVSNKVNKYTHFWNITVV